MYINPNQEAGPQYYGGQFVWGFDRNSEAKSGATLSDFGSMQGQLGVDPTIALADNPPDEDGTSQVLEEPIGKSSESGADAAAKTAQRPPYDKLEASYPKLSVAEVGNLIGGMVGVNIRKGSDHGFENACAIRLSRALNYAGAKIPYIAGETSSGADRNWYIYRVATLEHYLVQEFGQPDHRPSRASDIAGVKGIISFDTGNTWSNATGHMDLWDGSGCVFACHWSEARSVSFWSMP